jgi:hypothetical protein
VIPAGQSKVAFTLTGGAVTETTTATITATYVGANATDTLTVSTDPCGGTGSSVVTELTFTPDAVTGGVPQETVVGTVRLSAPAPSGGHLVRLSVGDETSVVFPRYVWVAGGEDLATFSVTTKPVGASTPIAFTAQAHGASANATLTLKKGVETGGAVGGSGGVANSPVLTPEAIARGFRMTTFLSGLSPAYANYSFISVSRLGNGGVIYRPRAVDDLRPRILANLDYQTEANVLQFLNLIPGGDGQYFIRSGAGLFAVSSQDRVREWDQEKWTVKRYIGAYMGGSPDSLDMDPRTGRLLASRYRVDLGTGISEDYMYDWYAGYYDGVWRNGFSGSGLAVSESGDAVYVSLFSSIAGYSTDRLYRPYSGNTPAPEGLLSNAPLGSYASGYIVYTPRIGTGTLSGYLYVVIGNAFYQVNIATGERVPLIIGAYVAPTDFGGGYSNKGLHYDGDGNLWICFLDRIMRLYPPPGGYFGIQYPEAIYTRDDVTGSSHAALTLPAPSNLEGNVSTAAGFDLAGITGRVESARTLRDGVLSSNTGVARLDAQVGVRSVLAPPQGTEAAWSDNAYAALEKGRLPLAYRDEWELPQSLRLEIQKSGLANDGPSAVSPYPLKLVTRITGVCGDPVVTDMPNAGWPRRKNTLTLKVAPTGLPKVSPGRCLDITLSRKTFVFSTAGAAWEVYSGQTLVASSAAPNNWDVEDDHTYYKGAHVTVPAGTAPGPYEVRFSGVARGASNFTVTADDQGTAAVLKPLVLSGRSVAGGASVSLTVTLDRPAPSGSATVALWTTGSLKPMSLPDRVVIGAGQTTGSVTVSTTPGAATYYLHASYNGYRVARLDVDGGAEPPADLTLTGFTVAPGIVTGGVSTTGTVTLSRPAPEGGVQVSLLTTDAANVPVVSSVLVPEGFASVSFAVPTRAVPDAVSVTLTATYGAVNIPVPLTLLPQGDPPTVRITSPNDGATFMTALGATTADIPVTVEAKSNTAGVALAKVQLFADGAKIGDMAGAGTGNTYTFTWSGAPLGTHELKATATDAQGRVAGTPPVSVTVTDKPTVQTPVISPESGYYERRSISVTITCETPGATIRYTTDGSDPATVRKPRRTVRRSWCARPAPRFGRGRLSPAWRTAAWRRNLLPAYQWRRGRRRGRPSHGSDHRAGRRRHGDPADAGHGRVNRAGAGGRHDGLGAVGAARRFGRGVADHRERYDQGGANIGIEGRFDPTLRVNGAYNLRWSRRRATAVRRRRGLRDRRRQHEDRELPLVVHRPDGPGRGHPDQRDALV